jgi:transcriptional regulator with GAF, ATPase, and Fis domain/PAS domain-containing protein
MKGSAMGIGKTKSPATEAATLRRSAEAKLPSKDAGGKLPRTEADQLRLLHELQVHKVELEMQNEELRKAQAELEVSLLKYSELFDFAPVAYFVFDPNGLIREANLAGAQLLRVERQRLVSSPFAGFIADAEGRDIFSRHLTLVQNRKTVLKCELRLKGKTGADQYGLLQSIAVVDAEKGGYVLTSIIDGTIRKQLEVELQKAHASLELNVQERTEELTRVNVQLTQEIDERKKAEESLRNAFSEIKQIKERLQTENIYLEQEIARGDNFGEIIGQSTAISYVFFRIEQVAPQDATVLLLGETGTGKGVIARAIHRGSSRKDRPMITVNCTALPANLIESELFGREKGAFTGSNTRQIGRFELADGGTIFLDEIGEMPLELQSKLLRVIQDGEFERLGNPRSVKVDVRIIAASNRNLEDEIRAGRFREDLFYRLSVFPITIPPLRQRPEDIPLLVNHFIAKFNKKINRKVLSIPKETLSSLQKYYWPGNVRELESVIERAVIISQGSVLQVLDRFEAVRETGGLDSEDVKALADLEQDHILQVLRKTGWRIEGVNGAAVRLGLNPSTLRARMRKYGIHRQ